MCSTSRSEINELWWFCGEGGKAFEELGSFITLAAATSCWNGFPNLPCLRLYSNHNLCSLQYRVTRRVIAPRVANAEEDVLQEPVDIV